MPNSRHLRVSNTAYGATFRVQKPSKKPPLHAVLPHLVAESISFGAFSLQTGPIQKGKQRYKTQPREVRRFYRHDNKQESFYIFYEKNTN